MPDPTPPSAPAPWISDTMKTWIGRAVLTLAITGVGYLQTGQWQVQSDVESRDVDTVALLKAIHALELRVQAIELGEPVAAVAAADEDPAPPVKPELAVPDLGKALGALRSKVSKEEVDVYQQSR